MSRSSLNLERRFHGDFDRIGSGAGGNVGFEFTSADVAGAGFETFAAVQLTRAVRRG